MTALYEAALQQASAFDALAWTPVGATLLCPPFCPGIGEAHVLSSIAVDFSTNSAVMHAFAGASNVTLRTGGLYFTEKCAGYPDPSSGVCSNASNPVARECAAPGRRASPVEC